MSAGSKFARSSPLLGLAFLISATTAGRPAATLARKAPSKSLTSRASSARRRRAARSTTAFALATSSALAARIICRMSGTRQLLGELDERIELGARRPALHQLECLFHPVLEARRLTADVNGGTCVERDDVARRSADVLQGGDQHLARLLHRGDSQGP